MLLVGNESGEPLCSFAILIFCLDIIPVFRGNQENNLAEYNLVYGEYNILEKEHA